MVAEKRETVLIVEDDEGIAELERMQLERAGFEVLTAGSSEQALLRLAAKFCKPGASGLSSLGRRGWPRLPRPDESGGLRSPGDPGNRIQQRSPGDPGGPEAGVRHCNGDQRSISTFYRKRSNRVLRQVDTEHRLAETEARLTSIVDSANDAIIVADAPPSHQSLQPGCRGNVSLSRKRGYRATGQSVHRSGISGNIRSGKGEVRPIGGRADPPDSVRQSRTSKGR